MTLDNELLGRYAETRSEDAFAELVRRHLDLVYSAALRQVNSDTHLAQKVAQSVFTDLARQAASLSQQAILAGWLYTRTHVAAAKVMRTGQRRQPRGLEASALSEPTLDASLEPDWNRLRGILDEAMFELKEADREALLLRHFENLRLAEAGARLGLNENEARARVDRALERLCARVARRGLATPVSVLSMLITVNAVQAAPARLAAILTPVAIAGAATAGKSALAFLKFWRQSN
jgi:RNA polymerase sigma factor (sigma-70 family)